MSFDQRITATFFLTKQDFHFYWICKSQQENLTVDGSGIVQVSHVDHGVGERHEGAHCPVLLVDVHHKAGVAARVAEPNLSVGLAVVVVVHAEGPVEVLVSSRRCLVHFKTSIYRSQYEGSVWVILQKTTLRKHYLCLLH